MYLATDCESKRFMDTFTMLCADSIPKLFGLFDMSVAPSLLFYSYIPIVILSLVFAWAVYMQDRSLRTSRILLAMVGVFTLWVVNIFVQWTAAYHSTIYDSWRMTALFEVLIFVFGISLAYAFLRENKPLPRTLRWTFWGIVLATIIFIPTVFNIASYDFENCEGVVGPLWTVIYAFEVLSVLWVLGLAWVRIRTIRSDKNKVREYSLFAVGLGLFLAVFSATNIYGELTKEYEFNLIGPLGMVLFLALLSYLIIKYRVFRVRMFASQALVYTLWFALFALIFINDLTLIHLLLGLTLLLSVGIGILLIRSVRKVVDQKTELEHLTTRLQELDQSKNEFLSFATHQMRSPLVSIKWGLETLLDTDTSGPLTDSQKVLVTKVNDTAVHMAETVNDLLNISKIEQGGLQLQCEVTSIADMARQLVGQYESVARAKGLALTLSNLETDPYMTSADITKLRQVFANLIDNAIKYTDAGSITVTLSKTATTITVVVADTGRGMSPEDHDKLFQKFARGAAGVANKGGSGLGLYLAYKIIELHGGNLTATSDGVGKGSSFISTLPIK